MDVFFAYIDPGSGSLMIQAIIAGIIAVPFFFRSRISSFVRAIRGTEKGSVEAVPGQDEPGNPN